MSLSKMFAADQNINPAFRAAVVPTLPDYDVALDYACTQKLMGDIRNFLRDQPPIICKMIELYGAQCFVGGKTHRAKEILAMTPTRHYNWEMNPARKCPDCDGHRVHWTDGNADLAECPDCGACSDPDCSAAVL